MTCVKGEPKYSWQAAEQEVLAELIRRARMIGQVRCAGLTIPIVAQICGVDTENLRKAQTGAAGKLQPWQFAVLCRAWRVTWADLLGDWAGRCAMSSLALLKCDGPEWLERSREVACKAMAARRYPRTEGRSADWYAELGLMGGQSLAYSCVVAVAPVIREALGHAWEAPKR